jgi:hypothetical protein
LSEILSANDFNQIAWIFDVARGRKIQHRDIAVGLAAIAYRVGQRAHQIESDAADAFRAGGQGYCVIQVEWRSMVDEGQRCPLRVDFQRQFDIGIGFAAIAVVDAVDEQFLGGQLYALRLAGVEANAVRARSIQAMTVGNAAKRAGTEICLESGMSMDEEGDKMRTAIKLTAGIFACFTA